MKLFLYVSAILALMASTPVYGRRGRPVPIAQNDRCCFSDLPRNWRGCLDKMLDSVKLTRKIERYMKNYAPEIVASILDLPALNDADRRRLEEDAADFMPEIEIASIEEVTDGSSGSGRKLESGSSRVQLSSSRMRRRPRCRVPQFPWLSCESDDPDECQSICDATQSFCGDPTCFDVDDFCEALLSVKVKQNIFSCRGPRCRGKKLEGQVTYEIKGEECRGEGQEGQCCLDVYALAREAYRYWIEGWVEIIWGYSVYVSIPVTRWETVWRKFEEDILFRFPMMIDDMFRPGMKIGIEDEDGVDLRVRDLDISSATDLFELICPAIGGTFCCESNCDAGGGMDPHFKTWTGDWYNFQGACDLTLLKVPEFWLGLGLDIQVRTTGRYEYSYIEDGAIRIGDDILQVSSFGGYMFNGISQATMPVMMADKFPVTHTAVSTKEHVFDIEITKKEHIIISTFKDMVNIKMANATEHLFGQSSGLMGSFKNGAKLGRDGVTVFEDMDAFGQEWQVLESENNLFATVRAPQHPQTCVMPDPAVAEGRRRRLGASVAQEAAEMACDHLDHDAKDMCVYDVIATRDLEVAKAGAY